jgi:hypothetical protein
MTPYPLHTSDKNTKILITMFLLSMIAAFGIAGLNIYDKVGRMKIGVAQRYGSEAADTPQSPFESAAELPIEDSPEAISSPIAARMNTFGSLVDITHPHLFQIPIMLFVLAHFLMRTRVRGWFKLTNYITAFGGMIAFVAAPWLVRYSSVGWTFLFYVGAGAIGLTVLIMVVVPIWDMWQPPRKKGQVMKPAEPTLVVSCAPEPLCADVDE